MSPRDIIPVGAPKPIEPYPEDLVIHENPDSLVINHRGSQNGDRVLIILLSVILAPVFPLVALTPAAPVLRG